MLFALGMEYEKIDVCKDNCMIFYKEHKNETKCLKCGKSRFVEVINEDGEKVTTEVAHKQLRYMPLTPQMKWLFISKKTARHMRWHNEGVRENDQVMVHPSDSEAWKALDGQPLLPNHQPTPHHRRLAGLSKTLIPSNALANASPLIRCKLTSSRAWHGRLKCAPR